MRLAVGTCLTRTRLRFERWDTEKKGGVDGLKAGVLVAQGSKRTGSGPVKEKSVEEMEDARYCVGEVGSGCEAASPKRE